MSCKSESADIEATLEKHVDFIGQNQAAALCLEEADRQRIVVIAEGSRELAKLLRQGNDLPVDHVLHNQLDAFCREVWQEMTISISDIYFVCPGRFYRTSSGKVQRSKCAAELVAGNLSVVYHWSALS